MGAQLVKQVVKVLVDIFSRRPARPPPYVEKVVQKTSETANSTEKINKPAIDQKAGEAITGRSPAPHDQVHEARIVKEARQQMGVDCLNHYNFAVCGQSGVGKSSFINGFLGLQGDDACGVGEVESTQKIKKYSTKTTPYLMVWDIPGAGTANHPADTYFEDKKLYVFDALLILSSERFLKVDFDILRSARKYETPCVFVRTKCDISVTNRAQRDRIKALEASQRFREDVKVNFHVSLANGGLQDTLPAPELFFISNLFFWDDEAYSIYDKKARAWDTSLSCMDEHKLTSFIYNIAKKRAYPIQQ